MSKMTDYKLITDAMRISDIERLTEYSDLINNFPDGVDQFLGVQWIIHATEVGTIESIRWMLDQPISLNFPKPDGYTAMQSCIQSGRGDRHEVLAMLIAAGADLNEHGNNDWTPLHEAAMRDDFDSIRLLLDAGSDPTVKTRIDDCNTAEEEARQLGHQASADLIRDFDPDGGQKNSR